MKRAITRVEWRSAVQTFEFLNRRRGVRRLACAARAARQQSLPALFSVTRKQLQMGWGAITVTIRSVQLTVGTAATAAARPMPREAKRRMPRRRLRNL
jgi:hypothetical protein